MINFYSLNAPLRILSYFFVKIMLRIFCPFLFLLLITSNSFSQQKPGYNLLWKISGKGLKQPSYLFGTMHVRDKRAFDFSDSVMLSIQKCSAFALEIQPDTMIKAVFAKTEKQDTSFTIKSIMSEEDYNALAKRFMSRNGYSIDAANPMNVESLLEHESHKPDDKQTFVDAYLYGIARTMNKNIFGLENAEKQVDEIYDAKEGLRDRLKEILAIDDSVQTVFEERLVNLYHTGNIDSIYNFFKDDQLTDDKFIERNHVMRNSIIARIPTQNMFIAVGVAHLPGENGLIALLRKEGYTVTSENPSFTGLADNFKIDYFKMKWETYTDKENGFSMETPGLATKTTTNNGLEIVTYPDMANDIYYGAYAVMRGKDINLKKGSDMLAKVVDNYRKNSIYTIISEKKTIQDGLDITDVSMKTGTGYLRLQLRYKNDIVYGLYIGNKLENLNQPMRSVF